MTPGHWPFPALNYITISKVFNLESLTAQQFLFQSADVSPTSTPCGTPLSGSNAPKFGTVIPNRIFVGGIAANVSINWVKFFKLFMNMNVFWSGLITMVPEWNHFIFMQTDYPRAITKNSINTKMTISQEPLVEIDPTVCQNVSCMKVMIITGLGQRQKSA